MAKHAIGLGLVMLVCSACSKSQVTPAEGDGGADGGARTPPVYAGPFEAHVVARALSWHAQLVPRRNGSTVLSAGIFRYELMADGTAKRLGDDASYVKQMPDADDALGGYDVGPAFVDAEISGAYPWRDLRGPTNGRARPETVDARTELEIPDGVDDGDLRRAADGTNVLLTTDTTSHVPITVVAARGIWKGSVVRIPQLDERHITSLACAHLPSWQKPHLLCRSWVDDIASVHRLVGDHWELVRIPPEVAKGLWVGAVGHDGTLWLGAGPQVVRVGPSGVVDTLSLPAPDATLARASYTSADGYGRSQLVAQIDDGPREARAFLQIDVRPAVAPRSLTRITQIVPRADGEAWVLAGDDDASTFVVHVSRPAIAPLPDALVIGSEADQRNELRNTRPPVVWVGHCNQLFVALAKQRVDGSLGAEAVWSREPMIAAAMKHAVGKATTGLPGAALVEGRLGGRRVVGVLVWRPGPWVSEELVEKSTLTLASELTSVTGMPPEITCTAPVLERASKL